MKNTFYLLIVVALLSACNKSKGIPEHFDYGHVENGVYDNAFFKFKFPVDTTWSVLNEKENAAIYELGEKYIAKDNDAYQKELKKAIEINVAKMLAVFKYKLGSTTNFNPSIVINAENLRENPDVNTSIDYLRFAKKALDQTAMQIEYVEEKHKVKLGTENFGFLKLKNTLNGYEITQDYYVLLRHGFAVSFTLSYTNAEDKAEIYGMIDKLKI
jgi:hypothetical protein